MFLLRFIMRMITETIYEKSVDICVFVKKKNLRKERLRKCRGKIELVRYSLTESKPFFTICFFSRNCTKMKIRI